jgi:hypothetical protein
VERWEMAAAGSAGLDGIFIFLVYHEGSTPQAPMPYQRISASSSNGPMLAL